MNRSTRLAAFLGILLIGLVVTTCSDEGSSSSPVCRVEVTSPNGGESYDPGEICTVQWSSDGPCDCLVDIELLQNGEPVAVIAEGIANSGHYEWSCQQKNGQAGYRIRVTLLDSHGAREDLSDAPFSIGMAQGCTIDVTAPLENAFLQAGENLSIAWDRHVLCGENVKIDLLHGGEPCAVISASTPNDGSFDWVVAGCAGDSTDYSLSVTDLASNATDLVAGLTISGGHAGCSIQVTSPAGGESWAAGQAIPIAWNNAGTHGRSVRIELLHGDEVCRVLAESTINDGEFQWNAAQCGSSVEGYSIRVTDLVCNTSGTSEGVFSIRSPENTACRITVSQPELHQILESGQTHTIVWTHNDDCGDRVRIELYRLGVLCEVIAESTENDGAYEWIVSGCGESICGYTIRVIDLETGASDDSDDFGIQTECELTVVTPNGGETYYVNDMVPIEWETSGCGRTVRIEILQNGTVCATLARSTNNDGLFVWADAEQCSGPDGYAVRITDLDSGAQDLSDAPFRILEPCRLTITNPAGGAIWTVGQTLRIEWVISGDDCGDLALIELLNGDVVCLVITPETPHGYFDWPVAQCGEATNGYVIRVTDIESGAQDETNGAFEILTVPQEECALALVGPVAGVALCEAVPFEIRWAGNEYCGASVRLELLRNGAVCQVIAEETDNDGSFTWTPAMCDGQTSGYSLRIVNIDSGESAVTPLTFNIFPECTLEVLAPQAELIACEGQRIGFRWTTTTCCGDYVRLELLLDGEVCETIAASAPNIGSYSWISQRCGDATEGYGVRVTDLETGATDDGSFDFTIQEACELTVNGPTGDEIFCAGRDLADITWASSGCCGETVRIQLLLDGEVCRTIAAQTENDGYFQWPVEQCGHATDGYIVRVTDLETGASDESDFGFAVEPACRLEVLDPNGAEDLCIGEPLTISWTASDCCGETVRIDLLLDGAVCSTLAEAAPNNGSFSWTPAQCAGDEESYRIRVTDNTTGLFDESDVSFGIYPGCNLELIQPAGGETLCQGVPIDIVWHSTVCCGDEVSIALVSDDTPCFTIAAATPNDGRFQWVPEPCAEGDGHYRLRITDLETGAVDETDADFVIEPPCEMLVTDPASALTVCEGEPVVIEWIPTTCCGDLVKIELVNDGDVVAVIDPSTANDGNYAWNAVQAEGLSEGYSIRVTDLASGASDETPYALTILTGCRIELVTPEYGDFFCIGDPVEIQWSHGLSCCGDNVRIELFHNGILVDTITNSTPNDGQFVWPSAEQYDGYANGYAIRVTDLETGSQNPLDDQFSIGGGEVEVSYPNGGEELCAGLPITIEWRTGRCHGTSVKIELLHDGAVCTTITNGTLNDGSYEWTPDQCGSYEDGYQIRITDLTSGQVDESDLTFAIRPSCTIQAIGPVGGEEYCAGTSIPIRWTHGLCCGEFVRISLLQNGAVCRTIVASTENDGEYDWPAEQCAGTDGYAIRVTDLTTGATADTPLSFVINPRCTLDITYPNSGEILVEGQLVDITWEIGPCCGDRARIELWLDGVLCAVIVPDTENDGSFPWPAEQCGDATGPYIIRVIDTETGAQDETDVAFEIIPPCSLEVLALADGEYCEGDPVTIQWNSDYCASAVRIDLLNQGTVCANIVESTANSGEYIWPAVSCGPEGGYQVRVTDIASGIYADSPGTFTIWGPCQLNVTWPTAGSVMCSGLEVELLWDTTPCCGSHVRIELLRRVKFEDGSSEYIVCNTLSDFTENDGHFLWTAEPCVPLPWEDPEPAGSGGDYKLRISDLDSNVWDMSGRFKIFPACQTTILAPAAGTVYVAGTPVTFEWRSSECQDHGTCCGDEVRLELWLNGAFARLLAESTPNDRTFEWIAGQSDGQTDGYQLKVIDIRSGNSTLSEMFRIVAGRGKSVIAGS